jgi:DNA-binding response OmpR family regulator
MAMPVTEKIQAEKEQQQSSDFLLVQLAKQRLEANYNTGTVKLNKFSRRLNPESQEFKILIKLMTSKDHKATYEELLGDNPTKNSKRNLTFSIRNLKKALGILPEKDAPNQDIIKNIKKHGYMLGS